MSAFGHDALYRMAERYYAHGQIDAAIDALLRLLGEDADHSDAHAFLALCLVKRSACTRPRWRRGARWS
ncbi:tetratricopeptide repeat protein [Lysobacter enzymogenes]|nr:tetratricopeptide repeat protein [Lysobacter enzymogenes]QCW27114.1 tetratricopeptide repeat protein [Lysobacter enzymogenes]